MTKQPDDWLDDVPGDDIEDEDDEIIWVSKSEIKRDAEELKQLGAEMVAATNTQRFMNVWGNVRENPTISARM
jgi:ribosomal 50S subunit-associated protein YjgA (DUF615 family)